MIEAVKKLGPIGTISYIGALLLYLVATQVDFTQEAAKAYLLAIIGTILLLFSGIIYITKTRKEAELIKEALSVLGGVYNRLAEQISTSDKDKTVSITMTVDNLPDKIAEVIRKSAKEENK